MVTLCQVKSYRVYKNQKVALRAVKRTTFRDVIDFCTVDSANFRRLRKLQILGHQNKLKLDF